jgi:hypothetical protein
MSGIRQWVSGRAHQLYPNERRTFAARSRLEFRHFVAAKLLLRHITEYKKDVRPRRGVRSDNNLKETGHGSLQQPRHGGCKYEVGYTRCEIRVQHSCLTKFIIAQHSKSLQVNQTNLQSGLNSFFIGNHEKPRVLCAVGCGGWLLVGVAGCFQWLLADARDLPLR